MKTLYIIGNGFDIAHDLPTRYKHFHDFLFGHSFMQAQDLVNIIEESTPNIQLWREFEKALGSIDPAGFAHRTIKQYKEEQDPENYQAQAAAVSSAFAYPMKDAYNDLIKAFCLWARSIDTQFAEPVFTQQLNDPDNWFLTFNYTDTLETVYQVSHDKINYIHGEAQDEKSQIIVGHNHMYGTRHERERVMDVIDEEVPADGGDSCEPLFDLLNISFKNTNAVIADNEQYFHFIVQQGIEKIIVQGHGYGEIDWPYFETIRDACPNAQWELTWFTPKDEINAQKIDKRLGLKATIKNVNN